MYIGRIFNTDGPILRDEHYCIPPLSRVNLPEILTLIKQRKYFVIHTPRQTGKTTLLLALADEMNSTGQYRCVYANIEPGQTARDNVGTGVEVILGELASRAREMLGDGSLESIWSNDLARFAPERRLQEGLSRWAAVSEKTLVLLIDEIDSLSGDSLLPVLRQLRAGYDKRSKRYPSSVVLCGVRDYRIDSATENRSVWDGRAFNIRTKSLRLSDFSRKEVETLYAQHTEESGHQFSDSELDAVWEQTQGQP